MYDIYGDYFMQKIHTSVAIVRQFVEKTGYIIPSTPLGNAQKSLNIANPVKISGFLERP
ncbi:MAG: hypothetical protein K2N80_14385 [Lachnospiraceae bacterium]|nr:hypothetical protein [Lachnospiraceae bacterium]